jgi:hypothetical protein
MGLNNEEYIEELLIEAHKVGKAKEVIDRASALIDKGTSRDLAFSLAFHQIVKRDNEV